MTMKELFTALGYIALLLCGMATAWLWLVIAGGM